ncbi:tetratricopeptide repeat protein [Ktedonobacter sp. SOSP1-52]|uniref:tetratricopeptide repeat protein n=1 Tax=Ktedonobacter sp. SOSP1-52 TaxID=2778366 RepID=UPI0019163D22|nr:tetratricopeptide repeat protein [Ktedonobacter sp. SOSP1-52]
MRLYLLERRKEPQIQDITDSLKKIIESVLREREQRREYHTLKERLQDEDWTALYLDLCLQCFWFDPADGLHHLLPFKIMATLFNRRVLREANQIGRFFESSLPTSAKNRWQWASRNLFYQYSGGLNELYWYYSQTPEKLPALLNYPQELMAALCCVLGEANRWYNTAKAIEWYERALAFLPQEADVKEAVSETYYELGSKRFSDKRFGECIGFLSRTIDLTSNHKVALHMRGIAYCMQQQFEKAIYDFNAAIGLDPNNAAAYDNRGYASYWLQQFTKAIDDYNTAICLRPDYAISYHNRAYAYLHMRDTEKAQQNFETAVEKDPKFIDPKWMLVCLSFTVQRPALEVAEYLEQIIATNPKENAAQVCLGVALGLRGKLKNGLNQLEKIIQTDRTRDDVFFWKGMLCAYYYPGKSHLAMEAIEQALTNLFPPILLKPLYWIREDNPTFFAQYARPLLERYGI